MITPMKGVYVMRLETAPVVITNRGLRPCLLFHYPLISKNIL